MRPRHAIAAKRPAANKNVTAARATRRAREGRTEAAGHFVVMNPSCLKNFRGKRAQINFGFLGAPTPARVGSKISN
jgi:hypothetical protein